MTCKEVGCDGKVIGRGWCGKHYQRWQRAQNLEKHREYDRRFKERNRERLREQARALYAADPAPHIEQSRRSIVKRKYGLTLEEYDAIRARGCAICGRHGPRMALDHDHTNGKVRDALCNNCNNGLGRFGDDPTRLRAAASYLEKHR